MNLHSIATTCSTQTHTHVISIIMPIPDLSLASDIIYIRIKYLHLNTIRTLNNSHVHNKHCIYYDTGDIP